MGGRRAPPFEGDATKGSPALTPQTDDADAIHAARDVTKLRGQVELVLPGTLPNDGKVIEDARSYK